MMADELTQEEKDKAATLEAASTEEKSQLEQIGDTVTGVSDLLKSHVDGLEKEKETPPEEEAPFDIKSVTPEEFAKSIGGTKEEKVDYIKRLTDACSLLPQDMIDEINGERIFTAEMLKSMEDETSAVKGFMEATMYAMQEANDRTAVKDSLMFQTQIDMAKSIEALTAVVTEQNEKLEKSLPVTKIVPAETESPLPDLEGTATQPVSEQVDLGGGQPLMTPEAMSKAIKKTFPGRYGDTVELQLQNKYIDWLSRMTPEDTLASMEPEHRDMVACQLPN